MRENKYRAYASLKRFSTGLGLDLFGVADISGIKDEFMLCGESQAVFDKAVCLGVRLSKGVLAELITTPTRLYFHHYRTANAFLDQAAFAVSHYIQRKGFLSLPIPASQIIDWQNQKAHLSHKKIGVLAGLGWIGRNNLLVNKRFGSAVRLVTVLTDMPLKTDRAMKWGCGVCRRCITVCPAAAIKENPAEFDHMKCFQKLKEFQRQRLTDQYICGVCVNACRGEA